MDSRNRYEKCLLLPRLLLIKINYDFEIEDLTKINERALSDIWRAASDGVDRDAERADLFDEHESDIHQKPGEAPVQQGLPSDGEREGPCAKFRDFEGPEATVRQRFKIFEQKAKSKGRRSWIPVPDVCV